jgi:hypothetical protein
MTWWGIRNLSAKVAALYGGKVAPHEVLVKNLVVYTNVVRSGAAKDDKA